MFVLVMCPAHAKEKLSESSFSASHRLCCVTEDTLPKSTMGSKHVWNFSRCVSFLLFPIPTCSLFLLPLLVLVVWRLQVCIAWERQPFNLCLPRPSDTFPAANTRAWASAYQKGPCPGRDALFAQTKAPPVHLRTSITWPPKHLCKGNERSRNVIRWNR